MKVWVFGDSFACNSSTDSWTSLLATDYTVINKSSNGSSEYRIWKTYQDHKEQIQSTDHIIFCHTSYSRVYLQDDQELLSRKLESHPKCDLIFSDVYHKKETLYTNILETIWDDRYFTDNYSLLINDLKSVDNSSHYTFFESNIVESHYELWKKHPGNINHMDSTGNRIFYEKIINKLKPVKRLIHFGASMTSGQGLGSVSDAYPYKVGKLLNIESINMGVAGASNLQILHDILNYKFTEGDCAVLMWAPCNRDCLFEINGLEPIGPWQEKDKVKHWMLAHSESDLTTHAWYHIQHALLYLASKHIPYYNFAGYPRPLNVYKPSYMDITLIDSEFSVYREQTKMASDGHPGPDAHTLVAKRMADIIK